MQPLTLAATFLAASCLIIGCSKSEAATIAGTYTLDLDKSAAPLIEQQAKMQKMDEARKKEAVEQMKKMLHGSLELKEDMTFQCTTEIMGGKSTIKGTWKITKGTITLEQTHEDGREKKDTQSGTIKDGVVTIATMKGGHEMKLHFSKQAR